MFILTDVASIGNTFIAEMRDAITQKDSMRFRINMQRTGELLAYEISKKMNFHTQKVVTPLAEMNMQVIQDYPVLATILRAGLPFHEGFHRMFDHSACAFVGSFRGKQKEDHSFEIEMRYLTSPSLDERPLIVSDPMLATGKSLVSAIHSLYENGKPSKLFIAAAIASKAGVNYVQQALPEAQLFIGSVDPELNEKSYIVPGLGDAGDLSYGPKL
jgi:uracil phosphoribosyltransferase